MKKPSGETAAILATLLGIAATTLLPVLWQRSARRGVQVVRLTGVAAAGVWTEAEVRAGNYWLGGFPPARPTLEAGRPVIFRLTSADVAHTFYLPALGVGPVEVSPGHVVEVEAVPERPGTFEYYCTMTCGAPHFGMRGAVVVQGDGEAPPQPPPSRPAPYWLAPPPDPEASLAERGEWLFHQRGCSTCHGEEGRGGVPNYNYVDGTVPALDTLAERMFLFFPEDIAAVVDLLERKVPLHSMADRPPIPRFGLVLAQYRSIRSLIRNGNPAGREDPEGPAPPLQMPTWEHRLSGQDIDAVIAYLLSLGEEARRE